MTEQINKLLTKEELVTILAAFCISRNDITLYSCASVILQRINAALKKEEISH